MNYRRRRGIKDDGRLKKRIKNRLRGSKPSAFMWITSLLRYNRTTDWKYTYMHIYLRCKINIVLAKGNIVVVLRRKPDAMTMLPNV